MGNALGKHCSVVKEQKIKLLIQIFIMYQGNCLHNSLGMVTAYAVTMDRT